MSHSSGEELEIRQSKRTGPRNVASFQWCPTTCLLYRYCLSLPWKSAKYDASFRSNREFVHNLLPVKNRSTNHISACNVNFSFSPYLTQKNAEKIHLSPTYRSRLIATRLRMEAVQKRTSNMRKILHNMSPNIQWPLVICRVGNIPGMGMKTERKKNENLYERYLPKISNSLFDSWYCPSHAAYEVSNRSW